MNNLKVGDKVRVVNCSLSNVVGYIADPNYSKQSVVIEVEGDGGRERDKSVPKDYKSVSNNMYLYIGKGHLEVVEQADIKNVKVRPKYEWYAIDQEGIKREKDKIDGRSLKEISDSINERKASIKADEQLLRRHRGLRSKK